jgi:hypothetical protein
MRGWWIDGGILVLPGLDCLTEDHADSPFHFGPFALGVGAIKDGLDVLEDFTEALELARKAQARVICVLHITS